MILRRVIEHVKAQNWTAVALDFCIVVVGVFIGIQVSNWNEARVTQDRSKGYLVRLNSDFLDIQARLKVSIAEFDESLTAIDFVRSKIEDENELTATELDKFRLALNNIDATSIPAWRSATYTEMLSAGVLDLIDAVELKAALVDYDQRTEIAHRGWDTLKDRHTSYIEPILFSLIEYDARIDSDRGTDSINVRSFNFDVMRTEPEFKSALSALVRTHSNNRILQANQLQLAEDVLATLTEELE